MRNTDNQEDKEIMQEIDSLLELSKGYADIPKSTYGEHFEWEFGSHVWKRLPCIYGEGLITQATGCIVIFHCIPVRFNNNNPNCLKLWRRV